MFVCLSQDRLGQQQSNFLWNQFIKSVPWQKGLGLRTGSSQPAINQACVSTSAGNLERCVSSKVFMAQNRRLASRKAIDNEMQCGGRLRRPTAAGWIGKHTHVQTQLRTQHSSGQTETGRTGVDVNEFKFALPGAWEVSSTDDRAPPYSTCPLSFARACNVPH